jgi:hypothetical protein
MRQKDWSHFDRYAEPCMSFTRQLVHRLGRAQIQVREGDSQVNPEISGRQAFGLAPDVMFESKVGKMQISQAKSLGK